MEYKTTSLHTQQIDNERTVTGITAVMGNVDLGLDRILPGAFTKTISERQKQIIHLWNHQHTEPPTAKINELKEIGRQELPEALRNEYPDATGGLLVKRTYLETLRGNEALACVKADAIPGMSFGYEPIKTDRERTPEGKHIRNLRELKLYEVSDVNIPMNPATTASKTAYWDLLSLVSNGQDLTNLLTVANQTLSASDLLNIVQAIAKLSEVLDACKKLRGTDEYMMMSADVDDLMTKATEELFSWVPQNTLSLYAYRQMIESVKKSDKPQADMIAQLAVYERGFKHSNADFKGELYSVLAETKEGRAISSVNQSKIKDVINAIEKQLEQLEELLNIAEPPGGEAAESSTSKSAALTSRTALLQRLAIAERELKLLGVN